MNFLRLIPIVHLLCSCFATECFAFKTSIESMHWGQFISRLRETALHIRKYCDASQKSLIHILDNSSPNILIDLWTRMKPPLFL